VFNKYIITTALAAACSGTLIAAQQPQAKPQPGAEAQTSQKKTATVVGCVYREKDVPGRAPNVAERAGVLEDYILAEVSSFPEKPAGKEATGTIGTSGTVGAMYKLEFVDDTKLKSLVGKRVEAVGRIDVEKGDSPAPAPGTTTSTTDKIIGRDRVNLSEFEVSTIKEVTGSCPATPSGR